MSRRVLRLSYSHWTRALPSFDDKFLFVIVRLKENNDITNPTPLVARMDTNFVSITGMGARTEIVLGWPDRPRPLLQLTPLACLYYCHCLQKVIFVSCYQIKFIPQNDILGHMNVILGHFWKTYLIDL